MDNSKEKAFNRSLRYLGYRMRTRKEIYEYLLRKNFSEEDILYALDRLEEYKFIDDEEFAEYWIRDRFNIYNQGKFRIRRDLLRKGIDRDLVDEKIDEFFTYEIEKEKIIQLYLKKNPQEEKLDEKKYSSLYNYLIRRGFTASLVSKILKEKNRNNN